MINEQLKNEQLPHSFSSRRLAAEASLGLRTGEMSLGELELQKLHKINQVLSHPEIDSLIEEGNITLAIVKPRSFEGKDLPPDDDEAAEVIKDEIGRDNIVFEFSTQLSPVQVEDFYGDLKEQYSRIDTGGGKTVWDTISEFGASGSLTFLLLYRQDGDAVSWWREKMGKTRASEADSNSIRGRHAIQEKLPNNLTHGSDSIDSVKKELGVLRRVTQELESRATECERSFPRKELLQSLNVLGSNDEAVSIKRIFESGFGGESWVYGYKVMYLDEGRNERTRYIKEKDIISFGGDLAQKARDHIVRAENLQDLGIEIPHVYGVAGASIYQDFIINDETSEVYSSIQQSPSLSLRDQKALDQLILIGKKIDKAGFTSLGFLGDLIFDGEDEKFKYIDYGFDLGSPSDNPSKNCLRSLLTRFRRHASYINIAYQELDLPQSL